MNTLSSQQVQELLHISRPTLYLWVKQGKLRPRRAGRALLFVEEEVLALIKSCDQPMSAEEQPHEYGELEAVYEILSRRYDGGETDVAARHEEHQP